MITHVVIDSQGRVLWPTEQDADAWVASHGGRDLPYRVVRVEGHEVPPSKTELAMGKRR